MLILLNLRRLRGNESRTLFEIEFSLLDDFRLLIVEFSLLQLVLVDLGRPLDLLSDHLSVVLLLHDCQAIIRLLVLLVQAPLVHLGLSKASGFGYSATSLLGPVWILCVLLH